MDPVEIEAGWLRLRPWRPSDADIVLMACSDALTQRWTTVPVPYTAQHARTYVGETSAAGWAIGEDLTWAVCEAAGGAVLASLALRTTGTPGVRDVGYWAVPAARGRGVIAQALRAVCTWAARTFPDLARVEWRANAGNIASRRAAEKAGFRLEGVRRRGHLHRGLVTDEWVGAWLPGEPQADTAPLPAFTTLTDGAVTLRRWRSADASNIARAYDPQIERWIPPLTRARIKAGTTYVEAADLAWLDGSRADLAVLAADGALLGGVSLALARRASGEAEVGYWVAPWARGRGVASAGTALLTRWGLDVLGLSRVSLWVQPSHTASRRVAERAGFAFEGVARQTAPAPDGRGRVDLAVYAILA